MLVVRFKKHIDVNQIKENFEVEERPQVEELRCKGV
jgi:hypothetical protein